MSTYPILSTTKRIGYIDSMRGFTMILVVLNHVALFCLNITKSIPSFHEYLQEFRMPMFFFISGFVLYKPAAKWDDIYIFEFFKKKIPVQIISPLFFYCIYMYLHNISFKNGMYSETKFGYWFTFVLFVFFIYYAIIRYILNLVKVNSYISDIVILLLGFTFYFTKYVPISSEIRGFLCITNWYLFVFFTIGTLVRKHFDEVQSWLDTKPVIFIAITVFFFSNIFSKEIGLHSSMFLLFLTSLSGIILVFSFFRAHKDLMSKSTYLGRSLQYVGRHTLDIYLLHFFLLPVMLKESSLQFLRSHPVPIIEFSISFTISLLIIFVCLVMSNIIRMSPMLAHFLFGAKYQK